MRKPNKNFWLLILMIISQVMLTGLLVQWLRSQWLDEKEALQKDIDSQFMECVNQVMDSMLVKHIIVPVLNDSSVNEDRLIRFNNKISVRSKLPGQHVTAIFNNSDGNNQTVMAISIPDSGKINQKSDIGFKIYDSTEKKFLLRSVKLIISNTTDSAANWSHFNRMVSAVPDTILLKNLFESKLEAKGDRFNIRWKSDSVKEAGGLNSSVLYLKSNLFEKPFNAEIINYRKIILRGISAQILFALVLLVFTGAAFFFTYRSLKKQEALNILRNDFISNISHELKTPVSTVSIALEALKGFNKTNDRIKSEEYLDIAFKETKRLDQLISQVLSTSVLENQHQFLMREEADLAVLIAGVLSSMQLRFQQQNAKVDFNKENEISLLNLDKLHIQGVLLNLIDNSLKYCSDNPHIQINLAQKQSCVILTVTDNGQGIPVEYIPKVFDKFFRVPKGDIHDVKGYGLGLSYAELVMKQHAGSISVKNVKGGGCEFTLTFPIIKR